MTHDPAAKTSCTSNMLQTIDTTLRTVPVPDTTLRSEPVPVSSSNTHYFTRQPQTPYKLPDINKIQQDGTVCRYLFTANLLYMFRVSIAPIIRST